MSLNLSIDPVPRTARDPLGGTGKFELPLKKLDQFLNKDDRDIK